MLINIQALVKTARKITDNYQEGQNYAPIVLHVCQNIDINVPQIFLLSAQPSTATTTDATVNVHIYEYERPVPVTRSREFV